MTKKKYGQLSTRKSKKAEQTAILDGKQWMHTQIETGKPICRRCGELEKECECKEVK